MFWKPKFGGIKLILIKFYDGGTLEEIDGECWWRDGESRDTYQEKQKGGGGGEDEKKNANKEKPVM